MPPSGDTGLQTGLRSYYFIIIIIIIIIFIFFIYLFIYFNNNIKRIINNTSIKQIHKYKVTTYILRSPARECSSSVGVISDPLHEAWHCP